MATERSETDADPAHMAPRDVLQLAIGSDRAIRCTTAHGRETTFLPAQTEPDPVWVALDEPDETGAVVTETHVRNAVARCQPDVELIPEGEVDGP